MLLSIRKVYMVWSVYCWPRLGLGGTYIHGIDSESELATINNKFVVVQPIYYRIV